MTDRDKYVKALYDFLEDNRSKTMLVQGLDDDNKLREALDVLSQRQIRGIIRLSNNLSDIPSLFARSGIKIKKAKYDEIYNYGLMQFKFDSYTTKAKMIEYTNNEDFVIIWAVQSIDDRIEEHKWFIDMIKGINAKKIILITTNDQNHYFRWLKKYMDVVYYYDSAEDNKSQFDLIELNLRRKFRSERIVDGYED